MQDIILTAEKIEKLCSLYEVFKKAEEEASNELSKAMMNANRRIKYKNDNFEEKILWDELRYEGIKGEAGKVLKEKYPKVFEKAEVQDKAGADYTEFCKLELDLDSTRLKLFDIVRLSLAVVDYKLKQKDEKNNN
jgi:hypothetical protein